ncbi:uncharacterized protein AAG666_014073 isoform 2-T3 [Megaptera novaeangliae]
MEQTPDLRGPSLDHSSTTGVSADAGSHPPPGLLSRTPNPEASVQMRVGSALRSSTGSNPATKGSSPCLRPVPGALPTEPSALPGEVGKELSPGLVTEKDETADPRRPAAGTLHRRVVSPEDPGEASPHLAEAQVGAGQ